MSTRTRPARKNEKSIRQRILLKNMSKGILKEELILEYASYVADKGLIPECLEVLYYAVQIFTTTITDDKILPVITKLTAKLRLEAQNELRSLEYRRYINSCCSCSGIFHEPITIACGHTYCKQCLDKDNNNYILCKICYVSYISINERDYSSNILMTSLVNKFWEEEARGASMRTKANELFSEKKFNGSLQIYNKALTHAPNDHVLLDGRHKVLLALRRPEQALRDANSIVRCRPLWAKGHSRRATALLALGREEEAHVAMLLRATFENTNVLPRVREDIAKMLFKTLKREGLRDESELRSGHADSDNHPKYCKSKRNSKEEPVLPPLERLSKINFPKSKKGHFCYIQFTLSYLSHYLPVFEIPLIRRIISKFNLELKNVISSSIKKDRMIEVDKIVKADFECTVCYLYYYRPVTTPCGHTFCLTCLERSLDHSPFCPLCKSSLVHYLAENCLHTNEFIDEVMKRFLPEEYKERKTFHAKELSDFSASGVIPIFVATVAIPSIACPLHVYEPRYRLMIRRCIAADNKQFGMCMPSATEENGYASYGTTLEIKDIKYIEDGRSIIHTVGLRRFKCITKGIKDGYDTVVAEFLQDDEVPSGSLDDLQQTHNSVHLKAKAWFLSIDDATQSRILSHYGAMPIVEKDYWKLIDGPAWIWWLIAVLPLEPAIQIKIISESSLRNRLDLISRILRCVYLHQSRSKPLTASVL